MFKLVLIAPLLVIFACQARKSTSDAKEFQNMNLKGQDFGLGDKELVLTLDDGPGEGTKAIVEFLKKRKIPATFFLIGKNVQKPEYKELLTTMGAEPLIILGNHSMNHSKALNTGAAWAVSEVKEADKIINPFIGPHQHLMVMRPPYGALAGKQALINSLNAGKDVGGQKLGKYIGPIFWDIGGAEAADWACWLKKKISVAACRNLYLKEIAQRGKGIILTHDVYKQTAELLVGDGKSTGLIDQAIAKGFKFVPLNKLGNEALLKKFKAVDRAPVVAKIESYNLADNPAGGIDLAVVASGVDRLTLEVDGVQVDSVEGLQARFHHAAQPGAYELTIKGFSGADKIPVVEESMFHRIGVEADAE